MSGVSLYGDTGLDPGEGDIILDWIADNPSTMSEASGAGVKDWKFFLSKGLHRPLPGVTYLGSSSALRYRYFQPATFNSKYFIEFLDDRGSVLSGVEPPSLEIINSEFVPPSEMELYRHVMGFGTPAADGSHISTTIYAGLLRELRGVERCPPSITGWMTPRALPKIKVPSATSPGIRWKKMGYRTKREALMPAIYDATIVLNRLIEDGKPYQVPPCGVAGRGKRMSSDRVSGVKKEGRLIVMPDLTHHLLGTMASGPLLGEIRGYDKSDGGVLLGMGPFSANYQELAEWCSGAASYFFLDFSGFDQKVPAPLLSHVMRYVSSKFEKTPGSAAYWRSQVENLVRTEICMPDGSVYKKSRGVASGDPWTSIAGSYANWIALKRVCNRMGLKVKIWTFGDDSLVAVYDQVMEKGDLERVSRLLEQDFGMVVSTEKSYTSTVLVDIADDPHARSGSFLSMHFLQTVMGVRPTRSLQDLYELMMVPERNRDTLHWEVVRTSMAYLTFFYNETARYVIEEYWDWLHFKYRIPELSGTADDLRLLRDMDIPWSSFRWEWLNRLPRPGEVELQYKYGHTGFFSPSNWGAWYAAEDRDPRGNAVSFPLPSATTQDPARGR